MRWRALPVAFRRLWLAHTISVVGDAVSAVTILLWIYEATGQQVTWVSGAVLAGFLPPLVVGLFFSGLADVRDRRRVMIVTDLLRAGLAVLLAGCAYAGQPGAALVCLAVMSGLGAVFSAARQGLVATVVDAGELTRANGLMSLTAQLSFVGGPAAAAVLLATVGPAPAILIDGATFLASALVLGRVTRTPGGLDRSPEAVDQPPAAVDQLPAAVDRPLAAVDRPPAAHRLVEDATTTHAVTGGGALATALRAIAADRGLLLATVAATLVAVSAGVNNTVMVLFLDRDLHGSASDVAWLAAANGIAQLAAGGAVVAFASRLPVHRTVAVSLAVMAVSSVALAAAPLTAVAIGAVVLVALANSPFNVASTSLEQTVVEPAVIGRVAAVTGGIASAAFLVGSLGGGWLADLTGGRIGIGVSAGCLALAALVCAPLLRMSGEQDRGEQDPGGAPARSGTDREAARG